MTGSADSWPSSRRLATGRIAVGVRRDSRCGDRAGILPGALIGLLLGTPGLPAAAAQAVGEPAAESETADGAAGGAADSAAATSFEAELEQRGALIGAVNVTVENVFNPADPAEDKPLYRLANRIHVTTRESVIRSILLFEPGDAYVARVVDESARLLRNLRYVADAAVRPADYDASGNTVDIDVVVRDSWSLKPSLKLGRSGGANEYGFGLVEENLAGRGKRLDIAFRSDVDRDERLFSYTDNNINNGRDRFTVLYADNSDGKRAGFEAGRPFFSLDSRWSFTASLLDDERIESMYDLGEVIDEFHQDTRTWSIYGGRSRGYVDGRTVRWLGGVSYEEDIFRPTVEMPEPMLLPGNRELAYPWAGIQIVADDYRELTELNDIGRTEDVPLGLNFFFSVGRSDKVFGADREAWIFSTSASRGWEPGGPGRLLLLDASASARLEADRVRNGIVHGSVRYYRRNMGRHLFSASVTATLSNNLDAENQVLLGGDNNLRGYPLRYQAGERSATVTIEQRFFSDWYPFRLIRVGYAVFFDAGRVWGSDPRGTPSRGTLYDVGIGLRLTSPRASRGSVVHIDLAFPINADQSIDNVQLLVEKKASF